MLSHMARAWVPAASLAAGPIAIVGLLENTLPESQAQNLPPSTDFFGLASTMEATKQQMVEIDTSPNIGTSKPHRLGRSLKCSVFQIEYDL